MAYFQGVIIKHFVYGKSTYPRCVHTENMIYSKRKILWSIVKQQYMYFLGAMISNHLISRQAGYIAG